MPSTLPDELLARIQGGENIEVEFKKSTNDITKDVYETICAFSNRDGGHIFLGVKDNGTILGINPECIDRMKKNFVTVVNNDNKMYPPLYLTPVEYEYDGKIILYIRVPVSPSVCRCSGRIYDRNHEGDFDITDQQEAVYRLYTRKQNSYFVNRVFPIFKPSDLRHDLIERARTMTRARMENHPWKSMDDEELLRTSGLILRDSMTGNEGITLAAILLFGPDELIFSVLAHHKTDAIYRVFNTDRYDDRDIITTNLLDSYKRLFEFGCQHLNDNFTLDGIISVSSRNKILREIISNLLAHRDYSNAYVAKFVIERNELYTENANISHGFGNLELATFSPFPKNPAISKVFREIGLADELGSGMRNTYKYTQLYSGGKPQFVEGNIFRTVIPLSEANYTMVGTSAVNSEPVSEPVSKPVGEPVDTQVKLSSEELTALLKFCTTPKSRKEMQDFCGIKSAEYFRKIVIRPMLAENLIKPTIPDKPNSRLQKYVKA